MEVNMKLEQDQMEGVDEREWVRGNIFIYIMKIKEKSQTFKLH